MEHPVHSSLYLWILPQSISTLLSQISSFFSILSYWNPKALIKSQNWGRIGLFSKFPVRPTTAEHTRYE